MNPVGGAATLQCTKSLTPDMQYKMPDSMIIAKIRSARVLQFRSICRSALMTTRWHLGKVTIR